MITTYDTYQCQWSQCNDSNDNNDHNEGTGMGRSCTSIDRPNKDEFWDGMTNPAMDASKEDISTTQDKEKVVDIVSSPPGGPASIPLTSIKG